MFTEHVLEHPTTLLLILGTLTAVSVILLKVTQLGKFFLLALGTAGLMILVAFLDWYVVTDREKVETVVYQLAEAVQASDPDRIFAHLAFENKSAKGGFFEFLGKSLKETALKAVITPVLKQYQFDFVNITKLDARVHPQSRTATATFRVMAMGMARTPGLGGRSGGGTIHSGWVLEFRETPNGVWKVTEISTSDDEGNEIKRALQL